jgi:hypothetical protein
LPFTSLPPYTSTRPTRICSINTGYQTFIINIGFWFQRSQI